MIRKINFALLFILIGYLGGSYWAQKSHRDSYARFLGDRAVEKMADSNRFDSQIKSPADASRLRAQILATLNLRSETFSMSTDEPYVGDKDNIGVNKTTIYYVLLNKNCKSKIYLFEPKIKTEKLLIFHLGHYGTLQNYSSILSKALASNISVAVFQMPFKEENYCSFEFRQPGIGTITINDHQYFAATPAFRAVTGVHPLSYFLAPLTIFIDAMEERGKFKKFYMAGISGGGWTTTVYSALDPRIEIAFSIAGDVPISWRQILNFTFGHYEEIEIGKFADYNDLYLLSMYSNSSFTRKKFQLYNSKDPDTASGEFFDFPVIQSYIRSRLRQLAGAGATDLFTVRVYENDSHATTSEMRDLIIENIRSHN